MGRREGVQSSYSTFSPTYPIEHLLYFSQYKAGYSQPLHANTGIHCENPSKIIVEGAESWISNRSGYPQLHLDCRGKIAAGVLPTATRKLPGTRHAGCGCYGNGIFYCILGVKERVLFHLAQIELTKASFRFVFRSKGNYSPNEMRLDCQMLWLILYPFSPFFDSST
ncbi:hypothetical protein AVEN_194721-1 [Araneus ventricosus]|uniref:Uncharacterized protein n=1 Tax=Araneus ventricosus TaxID=182803 RepID=A0A4Y2N9F0_ARAVE|nr:hypothetical protein AVEN_194721-1 [Araneus ventricosus]